MTDQPTSTHLSLEELMDYFSSGALLERQDAIEQHLAVCDSCTELGRRVYAATLLIDRWSAGNARSNAARQILYPALLVLIEKASDATLKERLKNWADTWSARADGALRMVIESSKQAAQIITEGMEGFLLPHARWQFAVEQAPALSSVRGLSRRAPISVAIAPGSPQARVAVIAEIGEIEVRIDNLPGQMRPPLVVLASATGGTQPQVKELDCPEGTYWTARFEGVTAGEYLVVLEPMQ